MYHKPGTEVTDVANKSAVARQAVSDPPLGVKQSRAQRVELARQVTTVSLTIGTGPQTSQPQTLSQVAPNWPAGGTRALVVA